MPTPAALAVREREELLAELFERHRRELHVHCYRLLGSVQDAEDLVQETFLRAWRRLDGFEGRASFRVWLYRIATNACLDALARRPRRLVPELVAQPDPAEEPPQDAVDLPWLQPYPDALLDASPETRLVERETIELAFVAATQHLPPRQRACLVLRDVLSWSARETAELLGTSVASANSLLQRARATMRARLPRHRLEWTGAVEDAAERELLRRYLEAWERADVDELVSLLREDARLTMPPTPSWYQGRDAIRAFLSRFVFAERAQLRPERLLPTRANRQPAFAAYARTEADPVHRAFALKVLTLEGGRIAAVSGFGYPELFSAFGLPPALEGR